MNIAQTQFVETQSAFSQLQTQQAVNNVQTQIAETKAAFAYMQTQQAADIAQTQAVIAHVQTEAAQKSTQTAIELAQIAFVQTQSAFSAAQTKAAEHTSEPTATKPPQPTAAPLKVGDMISFRRYEQDNNLINGTEPIEWKVLAVEQDRALLISWYGLDANPYNEKYEDVTWETSTLRKWLNGEFYEAAFRPEEKGRIRQVMNENPDNQKWITKRGNRTQDKIFLLDIDEVNKYFETDEARKCWATAYSKENGAYVYDNYGTLWWWLRSPGNNSDFAAYVYPYGDVDTYDTNVRDHGDVVRLAFWLWNL